MIQPDIKGRDVIAHQGQQLSNDELTVLVGLADGRNASDIANAVGIQRDQLRFIETRITQKLHANNKTHAITRAFLLGVLAPRVLSALLCVLACIQPVDDDFTRVRRPNRTQHRTHTAQLTKSHRLGGRDYT